MHPARRTATARTDTQICAGPVLIGIKPTLAPNRRVGVRRAPGAWSPHVIAWPATGLSGEPPAGAQDATNGAAADRNLHADRLLSGVACR
jgi:hypothetical protein